nr:hypothetical protein [Sporolactobacillus inulinus]
MQILSLEWLFRLMLEPNRLFKRYFIDGIKFIPIFYKEFINTYFTNKH